MSDLSKSLFVRLSSIYDGNKHLLAELEGQSYSQCPVLGNVNVEERPTNVEILLVELVYDLAPSLLHDVLKLGVVIAVTKHALHDPHKPPKHEVGGCELVKLLHVSALLL